jgi:hypothetical protein
VAVRRACDGLRGPRVHRQSLCIPCSLNLQAAESFLTTLVSIKDVCSEYTQVQLDSRLRNGHPGRRCGPGGRTLSFLRSAASSNAVRAIGCLGHRSVLARHFRGELFEPLTADVRIRVEGEDGHGSKAIDTWHAIPRFATVDGAVDDAGAMALGAGAVQRDEPRGTGRLRDVGYLTGKGRAIGARAAHEARHDSLEVRCPSAVGRARLLTGSAAAVGAKSTRSLSACWGWNSGNGLPRTCGGGKVLRRVTIGRVAGWSRCTWPSWSSKNSYLSTCIDLRSSYV